MCACLTIVRHRTPRQAISIYLGAAAGDSDVASARRLRARTHALGNGPSRAEQCRDGWRGNVARAERLSLDFPLSLFLSFFLSFLTLRVLSLFESSVPRPRGLTHGSLVKVLVGVVTYD